VLNLVDAAHLAGKGRKVAKKWIKGAVEHPGAFRAKAEAAGKSTAEFAKEHEDSPGTLGKQARLAETLMHMTHKPRSQKSARKAMYGSKE
jgi:hypothetical protein